MNKLICILPVFLIIHGCNQKEPGPNPPYDPSKLWEIHHQTEWDSLSMANHLVGKWKWNYAFCCGEGTQNEIFTNDENLVVQFFDNGTLEVEENDILIQTSNWHLRIEDADLFGIVADPPVIQLYGRIFFTDSGILFNNSYIDGGDNYFIKIE